jgi:polar amino acid transport system substrate-binding protein
MRTLILLLLSAIAMTATATQDVLVVGDTFRGHYEQNADGKISGLSVDLLLAIAKKNGDNITFKMYPWPRALLMVANHKADIVSGMYRTPEREQHYLFCDNPYYLEQVLLYVRTDSNITWNGDLSSLKGKRVGVIRGWYYGPKFDYAQRYFVLSTSDSLTDGVKALTHGLIDLLVSNKHNSEADLDAGETKVSITALEPAIDSQPGYLAFRNDATGEELRDKYNRIFNQMIESGEFDKIVRANKLTMQQTTPAPAK